ncbi:anhydro-N-acetylmuramic acid kinase [Alkalimarinus coralli]|uniref:anhydro-N-acetylmuramic acid kinase n=1 Tax=Alkalimarinus coralli TaxID=2935863 RepID=UPI00202B80AE|nr:anhydro-N-acetylmuramic acid kinase [Alkalimarinus coralli]
MASSASEGLYIGLMSGTSIDAVDAVLVKISNKIEILATHSTPISQTLKETILALCSSGENEIQRACELDRELGHIFAKCALAVCNKAHIPASHISAIGSHGQTIRHSPHGKQAFTLQIADPNTIAEESGITTVADFRRRDIAAGGQGAPLVPAFHEHVFGCSTKNRAIVNIGGMANITLISTPETPTIGFDTGPGNVLLDYWIHKHQRKKYDQNGNWAASGSVNNDLLGALLKAPYLSTPPPKSTGRELFNPEWLEHQLANFSDISPADIQCTLTEFTCQTIANDLKALDTTRTRDQHTHEIYICGGGANNSYMLDRLQSLLPGKNVSTTSSLGIAPELVESTAFAWLAYRTMNRLSGNLTSVTGARKERVLGAIYWGN